MSAQGRRASGLRGEELEAKPLRCGGTACAGGIKLETAVGQVTEAEERRNENTEKCMAKHRRTLEVLTPMVNVSVSGFLSELLWSPALSQ